MVQIKISILPSSKSFVIHTQPPNICVLGQQKKYESMVQSRCAKGASFENPKTSYPFKNPQKHDQTTIDVTRNTGAAATAYPEPTNERDHSVQ